MWGKGMGSGVGGGVVEEEAEFFFQRAEKPFIWPIGWPRIRWRLGWRWKPFLLQINWTLRIGDGSL